MINLPRICIGVVGILMGIATTGMGSFCYDADSRTITDWNAQMDGAWEQVLSSRFVVTTDLIDMNCVDVNVSVNTTAPLSILVHRQSTQHGHADMRVNKTYKLTDARFTSGYWFFDNKKHKPGLQLRCILPETETKNASGRSGLVIWTGEDNLTLMVWARNRTRFEMEWQIPIQKYLTGIDYKNQYKHPIETHNATYCAD